MGKFDSRTDPVKRRILISICCFLYRIYTGLPCSLSCSFSCVSPPLPQKSMSPSRYLSLGEMLQSSPVLDRLDNSISIIEATSEFAFATTRKFAQLPFGAFVGKVSVFIALHTSL